MEATCTVLRLIFQLPTHWRVPEGAGERTIERTPVLVRKCVIGVLVSICYDVMVVQIQHNTISCEIKHKRK